MSDKQLTRWFRMSTRPVREGVYLLRLPHEFCWSHWNGQFFAGGWSNPDRAHEERLFPFGGCALDATGWRGIRKDITQ